MRRLYISYTYPWPIAFISSASRIYSSREAKREAEKKSKKEARKKARKEALLA